MSITKYVQRLKRMDALIKMKMTGSPDQFAKTLGISRSTLLSNIQEIRALGCNVVYCRARETYIYDEEGYNFFTFLKKVSVF